MRSRPYSLFALIIPLSFLFFKAEARRLPGFEEAGCIIQYYPGSPEDLEQQSRFSTPLFVEDYYADQSDEEDDSSDSGDDSSEEEGDYSTAILESPAQVESYIGENADFYRNRDLLNRAYYLHLQINEDPDEALSFGRFIRDMANPVIHFDMDLPNPVGCLTEISQFLFMTNEQRQERLSERGPASSIS